MLSHRNDWLEVNGRGMTPINISKPRPVRTHGLIDPLTGTWNSFPCNKATEV